MNKTILFVILPNNYFLGTSVEMAIPFISSYVIRAGWNVTILDLNVLFYKKYLKEELKYSNNLGIKHKNTYFNSLKEEEFIYLYSILIKHINEHAPEFMAFSVTTGTAEVIDIFYHSLF